MPSNKNQHFVPRCHLKPFSRESEGLAINVLHHKSGKAIPDAPVKSQCSRSYFYGKDLRLEKLFQNLEGEYASIITKLKNNPYSLNSKDLEFLGEFCHLQMGRTDGAVKRMTELSSGLDEITHRGFEKYRKEKIDLSHNSILLSTLNIHAKSMYVMKDLEICLLSNETRRDFITSDDPAIATNRLYVQRLGNRPAGLIASGTQIFIPLTPRYYLVCYDRDAYSVNSKTKHLIPLKKESDVIVLNNLQYIRSRESIYFNKWDEREFIKNEFNSIKKDRPEDWIKFWVGVPSEGVENTFRSATEDEISNSKNKLIMHQQLNVELPNWLSILPYRSKIFGFTNGSGVGYVRKGQTKAFNGKHFWKEEILFRGKSNLPKTVYMMSDS